MKWLRMSKITQNMFRALARFWFTNANWDHGYNGDLKEYVSYSNSLWWDYLHMTWNLLKENLEPFPDTTACLSIHFFSFLPVIGDVGRLSRSNFI